MDPPPSPPPRPPEGSPPGHGRAGPPVLSPSGARRQRRGHAGASPPARGAPPRPHHPPRPPPRYVSKWVSLSAGLVVALCSGLTYLFSLYAPALRAEFGWNQQQIAGVGTAANLGGYLSIPAGLLFDALAPYPRAGPRIVVGVGCVLMSAGWGWLASLVAAGSSGSAGPPHSYASVAAAAALGGFGSTFLDTAAIALAVANHPAHRGTAVGVTKAALGLSGACWATAWTAAADGGDRPLASMLRGLAILPPALALAASAGVNRVPFTQADEAAAAAVDRRRRARVPTPPSSRSTRRPLAPSTRFSAAGHAILAIAAYETAAAVALRGGGGGGASPAAALDPTQRWLLVAGLVGLVSTLAGVPAGPGGGLWAVESGAGPPATPQPDCVVEEEEGGGGGGRAGASSASEDEEVGGGVGTESDTTEEPPPRSPSPGSDREQPLLGRSPPPPRRHPRRSLPPPRPLERPPRAYTAAQAVRRPSFAALAFICFAGMGSGLTVINNLGAIAASAGAASPLPGAWAAAAAGPVPPPPPPPPGPPQPPPPPPPPSASALVALFSVANCVGRLAFGHASETALHARGVPRPAWLAGAAALGALSALLAAAASPSRSWALPLAATGAGAAFGGHWAVTAAALPELFGPGAFASIYAAIQAAPAAGAVLLARELAGRLYDRAAAAQGGSGGECAGPACFGPTLLVCAALQTAGAAAAGALAWRARAKYRRLGAWLKVRDEEEEWGGGGGGGGGPRPAGEW